MQSLIKHARHGPFELLFFAVSFLNLRLQFSSFRSEVRSFQSKKKTRISTGKKLQRKPFLAIVKTCLVDRLWRKKPFWFGFHRIFEWKVHLCVPTPRLAHAEKHSMGCAKQWHSTSTLYVYDEVGQKNWNRSVSSVYYVVWSLKAASSFQNVFWCLIVLIGLDSNTASIFNDSFSDSTTSFPASLRLTQDTNMI